MWVLNGVWRGLSPLCVSAQEGGEGIALVTKEEVRCILAGSEAQERARRGEADLAAGRIQPLK